MPLFWPATFAARALGAAPVGYTGGIALAAVLPPGAGVGRPGQPEGGAGGESM